MKFVTIVIHNNIIVYYEVVLDRSSVYSCLALNFSGLDFLDDYYFSLQKIKKFRKIKFIPIFLKLWALTSNAPESYNFG